MPETQYGQRTDDVSEKLGLLQKVHQEEHYDLAMSLAESIKDTLTLERQEHQHGCGPTIRSQTFGHNRELPSAWAQWSEGWAFYKILVLEETAGMARQREPIDIVIGFDAAQTTDLPREVRVARYHHESGILEEVVSQINGVVRQGQELQCRLVFFAEVLEHENVTYLVFYGNPFAELPGYRTDLRVEGEGFGLEVENHHYVAHLSSQMGQLERLTYKRAHGLELFAGGVGHGEPPNIDWAHDYLASDNFQKFRVTNWAACPNHEVTRGPLCVKLRRWGFPHSPVHPLFTPSRMHITVNYTFYAGLPYFLKESSMDVVKDLDIVYLRDDEWVFSGYSFTDILWMGRDGTLREGPVPPAQADDLWGVGFFNRASRDAFIALWLEHEAQNFDDLHRSGTPTLNYGGHGQLWSRWAARDNPHFRAGTSLRQRNAYVVAPYPEQGGGQIVQELRHRLLHPLTVSEGAVPKPSRANAHGKLARAGETQHTAPLKQSIWSALREVRDEMFYSVDANVVDMGYIYDVRVRGNTVIVLLTMPHRGRPVHTFIANPIREKLLELQGVRDVVVEFTWEPMWTVSRLTDAGRRAMGLDGSSSENGIRDWGLG